MTESRKLLKRISPFQDRHWLYERSVQSTPHTLAFIDRVYKKERGQRPLSLREDFCGSALLAADWVRSGKERTAVGVDLDQEVLAWGARRNVATLGTAADRVQLIEADVLTARTRPVDVAVAFNFSYWVFHERATLVKYFRTLHRHIKKDGLLFLDLFGGPDAQFELIEKRPLGSFTYVWEQGSFDPVNGRMKCFIHFHFKGGRKMQRAFTYDWRIWTLPEVKDALIDAGFSRVDVYWEGDDDVYRRVKKAENCQAWIVYLVAVP